MHHPSQTTIFEKSHSDWSGAPRPVLTEITLGVSSNPVKDGGWAAYFRYGNSAVRFEKIMHHAWTRIALVIAKRHKRSRAYGWSVLAYQSPDHCGLISLSGTVVAPRPFKDWREKPNAGGERRR